MNARRDANQHDGFDLDSVIATNVRYNAERREEDFWAWEKVNDIVNGADPEHAFSVVQALVRAAPDDQLELIGAGPVENLVINHSAALIDWLESEARRDPRFREALASIWLVADHILPEVLNRLQAVTGNRILVATEAELNASVPREPEQFDQDH